MWENIFHFRASENKTKTKAVSGIRNIATEVRTVKTAVLKREKKQIS